MSAQETGVIQSTNIDLLEFNGRLANAKPGPLGDYGRSLKANHV